MVGTAPTPPSGAEIAHSDAWGVGGAAGGGWLLQAIPATTAATHPTRRTHPLHCWLMDSSDLPVRCPRRIARVRYLPPFGIRRALSSAKFSPSARWYTRAKSRPNTVDVISLSSVSSSWSSVYFRQYNPFLKGQSFAR